MTWFYDGKEFDESKIEKNIGFVYLLTEVATGRMYVGKKLFWSHKWSVKKGKKKKIVIPSDWKEYYSSSIEIQEMVKEKGPETFKREILHLVKTKGTLNYLEAREQFDRRVLENQALYFNGQIQVRVHHTHVKLS